MKILIADDSCDFRERVRNLVLRHKNVHSIVECDNGIKALQLLKEIRPDMIILDIHMPLMNGIQVIKNMKEQGIKTVVCILTSYPYPQYKKKCRALGADYFFNKSKDFEKINSAIEEFLSSEVKHAS
jgi:DNA-binding NarL/FixJ family response regulator